MRPDEVVARIGRDRAVAVLRTALAEAAAPALDAVVRGGFRSVEVTLPTPGALEQIARLSRDARLLVGAGTVLSPGDARDAVSAGARFLVSPVLDLAVLEAAHGLGVPLLPGIATPTEALAAHRAGALLQKLFPSPAGGPDWVRACLGPLPFLRLVPTSGVTVANASAWLAAGCFAVGCVGTLFDPEDLAAGRFVRVEERARAFLFAVAASARSKTGNSPGSEMAR